MMTAGDGERRRVHASTGGGAIADATVARLEEVRASLAEDTGQTCRSSLLLPCPFCGGRPFIQLRPTAFGYRARVVCDRCHVSTTESFSGDVRLAGTGEDVSDLIAVNQAIGLWNMRTGGE